MMPQAIKILASIFCIVSIISLESCAEKKEVVMDDSNLVKEEEAVISNAPDFIAPDLLPIEPFVPEELKYFETADPIANAESSAQAKKFNFYSNFVFSNVPPTVDEWTVENCIKGKVELMYIPGTEDVIFGEEHVRLQTIAADYAISFNLHMLKILIREERFSCYADSVTPLWPFIQDKILLKEKTKALPKNEIHHNNLGVYYFNEKNYAKAAKEFEIANQLTSNNYRMHRNLAATYLKLNKLDQAQKEFEKSLHLNGVISPLDFEPQEK